MKKLKDWIYKFDSYNLWFYKDGNVFMTKDYSVFGRKYQRNIIVGTDLYMDIMSGNAEIIWHEDCE